jgi:hypothetical protein
MPGYKYISGAKSQRQNATYRIPETESQVQNIRYRISETEYQA